MSLKMSIKNQMDSAPFNSPNLQISNRFERTKLKNPGYPRFAASAPLSDGHSEQFDRQLNTSGLNSTCNLLHFTV